MAASVNGADTIIGKWTLRIEMHYGNSDDKTKKSSTTTTCCLKNIVMMILLRGGTIEQLTFILSEVRAALAVTIPGRGSRQPHTEQL